MQNYVDIVKYAGARQIYLARATLLCGCTHKLNRGRDATRVKPGRQGTRRSNRCCAKQVVTTCMTWRALAFRQTPGHRRLV